MSSIFNKLELLQKKGELSLLELEFARFLNSFDQESTDMTIVTGLCCVGKQLAGHICVSLQDIITHPNFIFFFGVNIEISTLKKELSLSKSIGNGKEVTPLVLEKDNLYTHKFWKYEQELAKWLLDRATVKHSISREGFAEVDRLFNEEPEDFNLQKVATKIALLKDLVIISGGPGTGKTYTIRKILDAIFFQSPSLSIGLAAPTGKAAQRLNESLGLDFTNDSKIEPTVTIHKLLGAKGSTGSFRYNKDNKLPYDVVIIDEASMLDLTLWIQLIRAIPKNCKLILLGDKHQLASVEAGSILGDICQKATNSFSNGLYKELNEDVEGNSELPVVNDCIIELTTNFRFDSDSGIYELANAINTGNSERALELLASDNYPELNSLDPSNSAIEYLYKKYASDAFFKHSKMDFSFKLLNEYHILCALRKGPFGVETMNSNIEFQLKKDIGVSVSEEWFEGRKVLITKNNHLLKLQNGEVGVCRKRGPGKDFKLIFQENEKELFPVSRIQDYEPAFATTIHKSQGSEYDNVAIVLSNVENNLLSRELLYTAVTRARRSVLIIGTHKIIASTVQKGMNRKSGLEQKVWSTK